ncbi:zinc finger matrin-type protein 2-like [Oscarella lobularis]|uniref:zinc finger matrin-type protein 2-like n=1 Tax=Oscarella lobularis TaxID=121494 RepID=UPI0033144C08
MAQKKESDSFRRTWDKTHYEQLARERSSKEEEEKRVKIPKMKPGDKSLLKPRSDDVAGDLESTVGKSIMISNDPVSQSAAGFYCKICDCVVKDSINYLDHVNGRKHQRNLGMSMKVERSTLDQVKARFEVHKKRAQAKFEVREYDMDAQVAAQREEEEKIRAEKREKRRQRKRKGKVDDINDQGGDEATSEMAALMGFGGFGTTKKT